MKKLNSATVGGSSILAIVLAFALAAAVQSFPESWLGRDINLIDLVLLALFLTNSALERVTQAAANDMTLFQCDLAEAKREIDRLQTRIAQIEQGHLMLSRRVRAQSLDTSLLD